MTQNLVITAVSACIVGYLIGRNTAPSPKILPDNKETKDLKEKIVLLEENLQLMSEKYTNLRKKHNKIVDLVTDAIKKPKKS